MTKRMLVDSTHVEETRVALIEGNWLSDFDFERASKKQLKGNIYLAKVIRIEPSLQAAFVEYGGNRHGFLPFAEIHPDYYRIPMADRPPEDEPGENSVAAHLSETSPEEGDDTNDHSELPPEVAAEMEHPEPAVVTEPEIPEIPSAEAGPVSYAEIQPASDFAGEADHDIGLITDFGNAAIGGDPSVMPAPESVETVGGEAAEQAIEERYRRHSRHRYKIQEVVKRRQVMLIQVVKEERGNKGAALTTFLSLAGRYCVLMPNTEHGGGVSRKITSHQDRRRMKEILDQLEIPEGMAVILRTAGMEQEPAEIQRDLEYLLKEWNSIREQTLQSTAPALIYEEANLIKRSMRDLFSPEIEEVLVAGREGYQLASDFVSTIMPDQASKVKLYEETVPLFFRYNIEKQIDHLFTPVVQLRSGGYLVINPTEALVSIDVNSGKATRERHIESTALKTNLEAAEEIARQLRLRDLAGLVVIDFIDMEDGRNNAAVERRLKDAMRADRARLQIGRISPFGLLELSRQRLRPSLMEINFEKCEHCGGVGLVRSIDSAALSILRMIEEEGIKGGAAELVLHIPTTIALYILNQKRMALNTIERRYNLQVLLHQDDELVPPDYRLERVRTPGGKPELVEHDRAPDLRDQSAFPPPLAASEQGSSEGEGREEGGRFGRRRGRFGFGRGRGRDRGERGERNDRGQDRDQQQPLPQPQQPQYAQQPSDQSPPDGEADGNIVEAEAQIDDNIGNAAVPFEGGDGEQQPARGGDDQRRGGRRRGRRGGRGRRTGGSGGGGGEFRQREGSFQPREGGGEFRQRDDNYRPRQHEGRGGGRNWGRNNNNYDRNQGGGYQPSALPGPIDEIDTTPREPSGPSGGFGGSSERFEAPRESFSPPPRDHGQSRVAEQPRQAAAPRQAISSVPYEVVDHASDDNKPKGGWWKKLTGQ